MLQMQRGMRGKIAQLFDPDREIVLDMQTAGTAVYDYSCFAVDGNGTLSDDRYMVFYNQTQSPGDEIVYTAAGQGAQFRFRLSALPQWVDELVFTVSIDGAGTMGQIQSHTVSVSQDGSEQLRLSLDGSDFQKERAIISIEIYRKGEWRYAAVANGFNGGLADLLRFFGGEEVTEQTEAAPEPLPESAAEPLPAPVTEQTIPEPIPEPVPEMPAPQMPEMIPEPETVQEPVYQNVPAPEALPAYTEPPVPAETAPYAEHTEMPVAAAYPETAEAPVYEEAPQYQAQPAAEAEPPVQAKPPVRSASYTIPDPIRIPPPVIPPPVIPPPVIPVPQIRPTGNTTHTVMEDDDFAEMQSHDDTIINELMED